MELYQNLCKNCGGDLHAIGDGKFKCEFCGSVFEEKVVVDYADEMHKLFDEFKLEAISNARKNLYEAVNAEYISTTRVHECCVILKQLLPDDFQANFYEIAIGNNPRRIAKAIRRLDVTENASSIDTMVRFLILSLQSEFVTEVGDLIERAYKGSDLTKFEKFSTELSVEAEKIDNCIYLTSYPRDVFVAYSSKDMEKVLELVECLEEQGFSCFVAARNLRHGRGAVENYDKALREAMDNCTSFVFVSSMNSRHPGCDALKREIPYIKSVDIENSPAELRQDYAGIPHKYKKHRVEYRIKESPRPMAADRIVGEFFNGYERVYSPDEVADRIFNRPTVFEEEPETVVEQKKTKFCISCLSECDDSAETCPACGGNKFGSTKIEAQLMMALEKRDQEDKERREREEAERARREQEENERRAREAEERRRRERAEASAVTATATVSSGGIDALLKRVTIFLEDGAWGDANTYCEKILDIDPENAEAYLGKLMAEFKTKSRAALANCEKPFDGNDNYKKALRFGSAELRAELSGYIKHINDRNEQARLEELYSKAVQTMNAAKTEEEYQKASSEFTPISGYKDADILAKKCLELAENARIAFIEKKYSDAVKAMNSAKSEEDYQNASKLFAAINQYKDSDLLSKKCLEMAEEARIESLYRKATLVMNAAKTMDECRNAYEIFIEIKEYKDSATLAEKCLELEKERRKEGEARSILVLKFKYNFFKRTYSVKKIKSNCRLSEIIIPATYRKKPVTSIEKRAFQYYKRKFSLIIPDSVTSIGEDAFYSSGLTSVDLGNGVTSIGTRGFCNCHSLESISIPASLTSIAWGGFSNSSSVRSITVDKNNKIFHSTGNCLIETASRTLILGCVSSVIPCDGSVTKIVEFGSYPSNMIIPEGVTSIEDGAFGNCYKMRSIALPRSLMRIEDAAFNGCTGLETVYYSGTAEEWKDIKFDAFNEEIKRAKRIYNYVPTEQ